MRQSVLLFTVLIAAQAHAATSRCGTDAFGNAVCLDKDGAVIAAPEKEGANAGGGAASEGAKEKSGNNVGDRSQRPRCAIDPFGNNVCR